MRGKWPTRKEQRLPGHTPAIGHRDFEPRVLVGLPELQAGMEGPPFMKVRQLACILPLLPSTAGLFSSQKTSVPYPSLLGHGLMMESIPVYEEKYAEDSRLFFS